ncbi:MAG: 30S ribosomal protein S12 methylthiotransferase RimO [Acidiferrobacterales bacterium]|nr:30S ribosomal protein S12 methylthiotransferase RimO [Acidiferrobacterales bacterium]
MTPDSPGKIGFVSLGCPKATVDSERILTELRVQGYEMSNDYAGADLVIVNTCGFIDAAVEESLEAIGEAMDENGRVIVTGCLGAKGDVVSQNYPNLLAVTGPQATEEVMEAVHAHIPPTHDPYLDLVPPGGLKLTPRHYAYLKISEGCNHRCSFCIIPSMRGDLVSRGGAEVLAEAESLIAAGVKELLVVSQDTSAYGVDIRYRNEFHGATPIRSHITDLARALGNMGAWVRLHYVYPYPHVDDLIPLMADGVILPYLDIPFQHGSRSILKAMKRPAHSEKVLERIVKWRNQCPDLTLRSTFIVGFPGESEADFEQLLTFIQDAQIDRAGCFEYSDVEGASANQLEGQVPESVKKERFERFMETQQEISTARLRNKVGKTLDVMLDTIDGDSAIGRTKGDAPEVDGIVEVELAGCSGKTGDVINVKVTDATEYDLRGIAIK